MLVSEMEHRGCDDLGDPQHLRCEQLLSKRDVDYPLEYIIDKQGQFLRFLIVVKVVCRF